MYSINITYSELIVAIKENNTEQIRSILIDTIRPVYRLYYDNIETLTIFAGYYISDAMDKNPLCIASNAENEQFLINYFLTTDLSFIDKKVFANWIKYDIIKHKNKYTFNKDVLNLINSFLPDQNQHS